MCSGDQHSALWGTVSDTTLMSLARTESRRLARRWPALEAADIQQEILVSAVEHDLSVPESPPEGSTDRLLDMVYSEALQALRYKLRDAGALYCRRVERDRRRERAALLGYDVTDEAFYGLTQLRSLCEAYFSHGVTERPEVTRADSVTRTGDPAEGGTWAASLVDVERGLIALSQRYRARLYERLFTYGHLTDEQVAWQSGLSEGQVRGRTRTALQALQRHLGGASPWQRGPTPKRAEAPGASI